MYTVYVLESQSSNRYYTGHAFDVVDRLARHNNGMVRSTKAYKPWKLVYKEEFTNKSLAIKREMEIKSYKGGQAFKNLIKQEQSGGLAER